jgi:hypothetical protein
MPFRLGANRIGRLIVGSLPPAFSPADIAKYWWTADAGITESGGAVSAWVDQVGGLSIDQASGTLQPTLVTSTNLNNQNAIRFDGTDDYLQRSPISFASDGYAFTSIVIAYNANGNAAGSLVAQSYLGPQNARFTFIKDSGNFRTINQGFTSTNPIDLESPATTGVKVAAFEYDAAGNVRTWYNDFNTPSSYSGGNSNQDIVQTTSLLFGAYNDTSTGVFSGYRWNGDIAEVIWVPRVLTAGDITNLQTYINNKYNLSV